MTKIDGVLWVNDDRMADASIYSWILRNYPGIKGVYCAASTEEALHLISKNRYSLIVSNMRRPGDDDAGITLLEKLREAKIDTKYIIYSSYVDPEKERKFLLLDGYGYTAYQDVLEAFIHTALTTELVKAAASLKNVVNNAKELDAVLWVNDDQYADLGIRAWINRNYHFKGIHCATSTDTALKLLSENRYSLIISNMRRPDDDWAGITLLEQLRAAGIDTTYIVYTSCIDAEKEHRFYELGGYSYITHEPTLKYNIKVALNAEMAKK